MSRKRILLVDDEATIRRMMHAILGEEEYEFDEASNGLEALELMGQHTYELVITDVIMPDCDGIELVVEICRNLPDIKVVVISGGGRVRAGHYLELADKIGAARVLEKPFEADALRAVVRELIG